MAIGAALDIDYETDKPKQSDSSNNHRSIIANVLAALIFYLPNFLLFIPVVRLQGWIFFMIYNAVMFFLFVSVVSHVNFKI